MALKFLKKNIEPLSDLCSPNLLVEVFNASWYLEQNPDVAEAGVNPLTHYLTSGASEGRDPHPIFDTSWYVEQNPDVAEAGINPLKHYLASGAPEGRDPHPLFDTNWYLEQNPDVQRSNINPLLHYLNLGALQGRSPNPLFESTWYLDTYSESLNKTGFDPLQHYLSEEGRVIGSNPNRYFDRAWYLEKYNDVTQSGIEPLIHYINSGAFEKRDPGPLFQTAYYVEINKDVTAAGINPLKHFLHSGEVEGREPRDLYNELVDLNEGLDSYSAWFGRNQISKPQICLQRRLSKNFIIKPLISLIVPVYIVQVSVFKALVSSVIAQSYNNWELCISIAYFEDEDLLKAIDQACKSDSRIKARRLENNRGISHNSNDALEIATGSFVALLDHDDTLPPDALFEMASAIEKNNSDFLYSDKDAITESGSEHFNPLFKPSWSPEMMLSANYLTHFNLIRRSLLDKIGGWDYTTDGAQDWDIFLRAAASGARILHIPKILYHWRHVHTSVAARGLEAKPYAANSQLVTVQRWLESQKWVGAKPYFTESQHIRIRWSELWKPSVTVLLFGDVDKSVLWRKRLDSCRLGSLVELKFVGNTLESLASAVLNTNVEIIVIAPSAMSIMSSEWLEELVGPLQNSEIVAVSGKVLDPNGHILDAGWINLDGEWKAIFRGSPANTYSVFGSADWFRNYSSLSFNGTAFRRTAFISAGSLFNCERPDLQLGINLVANGLGRIVYNPFALSVLEPQFSFEQGIQDKNYVTTKLTNWAGNDPYFNVNLTLNRQGSPIIRKSQLPERLKSHDYEAEASYFGSKLDLIESKLQVTHINDMPKTLSNSRPLRVGWIIPDFRMPFYGGLMTILRFAEYLRQKGVSPVFIGHGGSDPESLRAAIKLAFPELAAASDVYVLAADEDVNNLDIGYLDAAFCTLWTTAYVLNSLNLVLKKFYFVQDYEPLFYPAGTTSSLVEATYRFGFFGICNTEPLKVLYEEFGSNAEFFTPAVDTKIFNINGRNEKNIDDPTTLFSYARPGHPRNCFELIGPALAEVKKRFGNLLFIYTAGANWCPSDYGLNGSVEHLGIMPYEATADLYRACDIGVVAMATCHPSYLPFELMSTGAIVCTNFNKHTGWLLKDRENCLQFELTKTSIVDTLSTAITNLELRRQISINGVNTVKEKYSNWDNSFYKIYINIINQINQ